jgi:hypothetical protein
VKRPMLDMVLLLRTNSHPMPQEASGGNEHLKPRRALNSDVRSRMVLLLASASDARDDERDSRMCACF